MTLRNAFDELALDSTLTDGSQRTKIVKSDGTTLVDPASSQLQTTANTKLDTLHSDSGVLHGDLSTLITNLGVDPATGTLQTQIIALLGKSSLIASGVTPVISVFSSSSVSGSFKPIAGRDFNIAIGNPGSTLSGTVVLERSFDTGSSWNAVTYIDGTILNWTAGVNSSWSETEFNIWYRLNCTVYASPIAYRLSQ